MPTTTYEELTANALSSLTATSSSNREPGSTSCFDATIEGVPCRVYSIHFRGPEGGRHRGWNVRRIDTGRVICDVADSRKSAVYSAVRTVRYFAQ